MKRFCNFLIVVIPITAIYFLSCSKKSSPPTQNCSNPSDCIVNTWYLQQWQANYNGSVITIYTKGSSSNLNNNIDSLSWVFASNNQWTEFSSPTIVHDVGTWKILPNDTTIEINAADPDTFSITSITVNTLIINVPFNHNYPSFDAVELAIGSGLDTAKLTAYEVTFSNQ
jgi:hypothetical protein